MLKMQSSYDVYDFNSINDGQISLNLYELNLVNRTVNNKRRSFWTYKFIASENPSDLEKRIKELRESGYISLNEFQSVPFEADSRNPLLIMKFLLMSRQYRLLEKVYDSYGIIEGMNAIHKYVHYVDAKTGEEFAMYTEDEKHTPEVISSLESANYKPIEQTPLMDYLDELKRNHEPISIKSNSRQIQK